MTSAIRFGLIGDYNPAFRPHQATADALRHAAAMLNVDIDITWLPTPSLDPLLHASIEEFDALWCTPGSPFQSMDGALRGIQYAREQGVPLLGTCAGFQHIVVEYARNVLGIVDAHHAEYQPVDGTLFITPLSCAIAGMTLEVVVEPTSRAGRAYGQSRAQEQYYCTFGLNPDYHARLHEHGLLITGVDQDGEARIVELPQHSFFVGTLFVPQLTSTAERPHPLIVAYVEAAMQFRRSRRHEHIAA
jgi:CTP synthase (UTP-ammonia lyase)